MNGKLNIQEKIQELLERNWDLPSIESRFNKMLEEGIPRMALNASAMVRDKEQILNRVQRRGEEYCYLTRNCARGSALALLEEFGLGNMEIIKAMGAMPGIAMSGEICGGVSGGVIGLSLYFSSDDLTNYQDPLPYIMTGKFVNRFRKTMGSLSCSDIQRLIFGTYYDPLASLENLEAFNKAQAREKCPLAPGWGARLAAEVIIESMEKE
jgi:C_GCAxxG_C_C family probable redox protein